MKSETTVDRDERTVAAENASYRWAYLVMTYGLLLSVAYRSFFRHEASWDLIGLVVLSGVVATLFQGRAHVLTKRSAKMASISAGVAAAVALVLMIVLRALR